MCRDARFHADTDSSEAERADDSAYASPDEDDLSFADFEDNLSSSGDESEGVLRDTDMVYEDRGDFDEMVRLVALSGFGVFMRVMLLFIVGRINCTACTRFTEQDSDVALYETAQPHKYETMSMPSCFKLHPQCSVCGIHDVNFRRLRHTLDV